MALRVSPISRTAAILIIAIGVFTLVFVNGVAGIAFIVLGVFLYILLYRFGARVDRELKEAGARAAQSARSGHGGLEPHPQVLVPNPCR